MKRRYLTILMALLLALCLCLAMPLMANGEEAALTVTDMMGREITLEEAREIDPRYGLGDRIPVVVNPRDFGRIAAQTAKQVIVQHMREAERGVIYDEYIEKENEVLTAIVQSVESNDNVFVEIGRTEGILEASQRMPGEEIRPNDRLKVYVLNVSRSPRGPQITVSRTHPGLVKRLFEIEVPEIVSGVRSRGP